MAGTRDHALTMVERRTIGVGASPHLHLGYVKEAGHVWISNTGGSDITVLDHATGERVASIAVGAGPAHFAFDAGCRIGYVALSVADAVAVVDPLLGTVQQTIALRPGSHPTAVMPAFERQRVYTLNPGDGTVTAIDTRTKAIAGVIPVGREPMWGQPWGSSYKPITRPVGKSYIVNAGSDDLTIVDDATDRPRGRVGVGVRPVRNAIFRERDLIYAANQGDDSVTAVRIADDVVVATIAVGTRPFRLLPVEAINGRDELWVLNAGSANDPAGVITLLSGIRHERVGTIEVVDRPANWVVNPAGTLFVVSETAGELCAIDVRRGAVTGGARLTHPPQLGAISGLIYTQARALFVLNADDTVTVLAEAG
jgi:YVTN family beta-propeller protein